MALKTFQTTHPVRPLQGAAQSFDEITKYEAGEEPVHAR